jgi:CheY-like chemotaxis protein
MMIPIVVVSADATANLQKRLLSKGASDYVTKPFDIARLFSVLDSLGALRAIENARLSSDGQEFSTTSPSVSREPGRPEKRSRQIQEFRHDLTTSLNVIASYAELLSGTALDQNAINAMKAIREATKTAISLVDRFQQDSL